MIEWDPVRLGDDPQSAIALRQGLDKKVLRLAGVIQIGL